MTLSFMDTGVPKSISQLLKSTFNLRAPTIGYTVFTLNEENFDLKVD